MSDELIERNFLAIGAWRLRRAQAARGAPPLIDAWPRAARRYHDFILACKLKAARSFLDQLGCVRAETRAKRLWFT
jgi:hypothetical protein